NKIYLRPGCKDCLYLPRTELGRGLHSIELRSEHMLLQFLDRLENSKEISTRRAAILKVKNNNKTHLALIKGFLKKSLEEAQLAKLYNEIEKQNFIQSYIMQEKMNLPPNEAVFCYIQDRNVSWGAEGMCQHCKQSRKTVNHLATRYKKMLGHDYTRRHDEVIRLQEIFDNQIAEIRIDTRIKTDVKFRKKRLVVFVIDISKKRITLLERASLNVMLEAESRNNQYFFNASIKCGIMVKNLKI
ncbi:hypothetical protein CWI36_0856p0010, partial [Hamiltosporidium magnivora]